jgi:hypothetical protein
MATTSVPALGSLFMGGPLKRLLGSFATAFSLCHEWPNMKFGATVAIGVLETARPNPGARNRAGDLATAMTATSFAVALPSAFEIFQWH